MTQFSLKGLFLDAFQWSNSTVDLYEKNVHRYAFLIGILHQTLSDNSLFSVHGLLEKTKLKPFFAIYSFLGIIITTIIIITIKCLITNIILIILSFLMLF